MIVVTAPTSNIGRHLVPLLLAAEAKVRVIVRDPARLDPAVRERVEVVRGSHGDPAVVAEALTGDVFWLTPPDPDATDLLDAYVGFTRPAAEVFATGRVDRVVSVSALGRGTPQAAHAGHVTASLAMDDLIAGTGVACRALTMPSFLDNLVEQVDSIREDGVFYGMLDPDRRLPVVAVRDIAAAAARLLLDRSWTGRGEMPVLGPEDLSQNDLAAILSGTLGRPVRYQQVSADAYHATMVGGGMSEAVARGMVEMMRAKNEGLDEAIARTAARRWCADVLS